MMSEDVSSNHNSCTKCELQLLLRWYDSTVPTDVINGVWVVLERSGVVAEDAYQVRVCRVVGGRCGCVSFGRRVILSGTGTN
jgi:hypothetical protein